MFDPSSKADIDFKGIAMMVKLTEDEGGHRPAEIIALVVLVVHPQQQQPALASRGRGYPCNVAIKA